MKASIRVARPSDAENLAALAIQVWLHTYATQGISSSISHYVLTEFSAQTFDALVCDPGTLVLVGEMGGNLIGYAVVKFGAPSSGPTAMAEVTTLYVQEHFLRRGVGTALLVATQSEVERRTGSSGIWLSVNTLNTNALAFYRRHGFVQNGVSHFELGGEKHENQVLVSRV